MITKHARRRKQITLIVVLLATMIGYNNCSGGFNTVGDPQNAASSSASDSSTGSGGGGGSQTTGTAPTPAPTATPVPAPGKKSVFMVAGHMGRTAISCDDGLTWIHDRSDNDATRCWDDKVTPYVDCDHSASAATSGALDYGDGWFYAQFGWGYDGTVRKSKDGVNWQTVRTKGWGGGITYANNNLLSTWEYAWAGSADKGTTWTPIKMTNDMMNLDHALPLRAGNKIFSIGRSTTTLTMIMSPDGGLTWKNVTGFRGGDWAFPSEGGAASLAEGNGALVALGGSVGAVSRSTDGGMTWTSFTLPNMGKDDVWVSNVIFDGSQFIAWTGTDRWTSTDGLTWSSVKKVSDYWAGPVGYNPSTKTFVMITNMWDNYYAKQKAYRSTDGGITWKALDAAHFKGGHPVKKIVLGEMDESACQ